MAVNEKLLKVYARSIRSKNKALERMSLSRDERQRLRMTIIADIRACGAIVHHEGQMIEVSRAALDEAAKLAGKPNLHAMRWHHQKSFDKRRKVFHWEHVETISEIQRACEKATKLKEIVEILKSKLRIAWILKDEDRKLTRLGFKTKRPDANGAYAEAGIILVKFVHTSE